MNQCSPLLPDSHHAIFKSEASRSSHDANPWQRLFDTPWIDPVGLESDDFSLNGWLAEGLRGLWAFVRGAGLNDEFWLHLRGVERELLLAARALIDARPELVEARERKAEQSSRLQEIAIDF